ncbi:MAG: hypothetical protein IPM69_04950 [Ignavibacteria bacterium]|nr:hypothetical protein [Ignavibacteria bacterium]
MNKFLSGVIVLLTVACFTGFNYTTNAQSSAPVGNIYGAGRFLGWGINSGDLFFKQMT